MRYSARTYNSKNIIQRYSHRKRLLIGEKIISFNRNDKLLDYGCGDATYLNQVLEANKDKNLTLIGFEPYMETFSNPGVTIYKDFNQIIDRTDKFDIICCFEVLEHFNEKNQVQIIKNFLKVLNVNGRVIISVPIEVGPVSLIKNILRKVSYPTQQAYEIKNLLKCLFYSPPQEYRLGEGYLNHMGFDHRKLEPLIKKYFRIEKILFSPFPFIGSFLNSQIFYVMKTKSL